MICYGVFRAVAHRIEVELYHVGIVYAAKTEVMPVLRHRKHQTCCPTVFRLTHKVDTHCVIAGILRVLHRNSYVVFVDVFYRFYNAVRRCNVRLCRGNLHFRRVCVYRVGITSHVRAGCGHQFFNLRNCPIAIAVQCAEGNERDIQRGHVVCVCEGFAINGEYVVCFVIRAKFRACYRRNKLGKCAACFAEPYVNGNRRRNALVLDITELINKGVARRLDAAAERICVHACKMRCVRTACTKLETVLRNTDNETAAPAFRNTRYVKTERTFYRFFAVEGYCNIIFVAVFT